MNLLKLEKQDHLLSVLSEEGICGERMDLKDRLQYKTSDALEDNLDHILRGLHIDAIGQQTQHGQKEGTLRLVRRSLLLDPLVHPVMSVDVRLRGTHFVVQLEGTGQISETLDRDAVQHLVDHHVAVGEETNRKR